MALDPSEEKKKKKKKPRKKKAQVIHAKKFSKDEAMSWREAREVTSQYHKLNAEVEAINSHAKISSVHRARKLKGLHEKLEALGGHDAYQRASVINTEKFRTSKYVFSTLTQLGLRPKAGQPPLRTLEIGAINLQLFACFWLQVRAIDLVSQHPGKIEALDFLELAVPSSPEGRYQVVVCFMVLNYVPTAAKRGLMLTQMVSNLLPSAHLFLSVPARCLDSSPGMTRAWFQELCESLGLVFVNARNTPKVAFFTFALADRGRRLPDASLAPAFEGDPDSCHFAITLPKAAGIDGGTKTSSKTSKQLPSVATSKKRKRPSDPKKAGSKTAASNKKKGSRP